MTGCLGGSGRPVPSAEGSTGVWRSVEIPDGNTIERRAIRFASATETRHGLAPAIAGNRQPQRHSLPVCSHASRKLQPRVADLRRWARMVTGAAGEPPPVEYTILPLDTGAVNRLLFEPARAGKIDAVSPEAANRHRRTLVPDYLSTIDRTIKKEPQYVKQPKYALVAFGPKAEFKVWVVIDGDVIYIDRDGNGDLTEKGERQEIKDPKKDVVRHATLGLTYRLPGADFTILSVWWFESDQGRTGGFAGVSDTDKTTQSAGGNELNFAPSPEQAAVIHFGSKIITFRPSLRTAVERQWRFAIPNANCEAQVLFEIGTPGVGAGSRTFAAGSFATFIQAAAGEAKRVDPIAEYEFTPNNPADGVKKVTVKLTEHIGQTEFGGKLTVPDGVKTGLDRQGDTEFPRCPWGRLTASQRGCFAEAMNPLPARRTLRVNSPFTPPAASFVMASRARILRSGRDERVPSG